MNFYIKKIILWCKNETIREIKFVANKVNVITGGSGTGKTAILNIIDYCLFSSEHKISEDIINENVNWYGISFNINGKDYIIARESPNFKEISNNYYFSSIGEEPFKPFITDKDDKKLKKIIEEDFSISNKVLMPFGAGEVKKNSKISFRYFLLFNSLSYSVIDNEDIFFDKQNKSRYRDALIRIFDLSLGIESIENILLKEEQNKLKEKLEKIKNKEKIISVKRNVFYDDISEIFKKVKEYGLISSDKRVDESIETLQKLINNISQDIKNIESTEYESIQKEIYTYQKRINNIKNFEKEYADYKQNLSTIEDSLKPIKYIQEKEKDIIKTSIFNELITSYEEDLIRIKNAIKSKTPINRKTDDLLKKYEEEIKTKKEELKTLPFNVKNFNNSVEKYIFIGEIKAKLDLFTKNKKTQNSLENKEILEEQLSQLKVNDTEEQRRITISLLEEIIQEDIDYIKEALDNYGHHKAAFNYKEKKLELRQPKSDKIVNTGSSSIDMFLHLLMFIGLHKLFFKNEVPYIAPYIIMDQPSKPYYGENEDNYENIKETDKFKIEMVFKLLNNFLEYLNIENKTFQIILFEHVPSNTWKGLDNIHLVEEFRGGNALIKKENITRTL